MTEELLQSLKKKRALLINLKSSKSIDKMVKSLTIFHQQ